MSVSYKCDKCGKELRLEDIYTVTVKSVGFASTLLDYDFCADCSCEARAAIDALIWDKGANVSSYSCRHVGQDMIEPLLEDVSKGVVGYPRERVAGYLEDNHPIGEAVLLDVRDRLRKIMREVDA